MSLRTVAKPLHMIHGISQTLAALILLISCNWLVRMHPETVFLEKFNFELLDIRQSTDSVIDTEAMLF